MTLDKLLHFFFLCNSNSLNLLIKSVNPHCIALHPSSPQNWTRQCHADRSGKPSLGIVTKRVGSSAYLNKDHLAHLFLSGRVIQEQIEKIWSANSLPCVCTFVYNFHSQVTLYCTFYWSFVHRGSFSYI